LIQSEIVLPDLLIRCLDEYKCEIVVLLLLKLEREAIWKCLR